MDYLHPLAFSEAIAVVVMAAVGCHLIFKRLEPMHPLSHIVLLGVIPGSLTSLLSPHYPTVLGSASVAFAVYLSTLVTSIIGYRLSPFHPLASYPGPILCKIFKLQSALISTSGKQHLWYQKLHKRYGDVVRVGPNELSICTSEAIVPIMGPAGLPKGPLWDGRQAGQTDRSLIGLRDLKEHARHRRPWNRAFTSAALKDYEGIIVHRASQLVAMLLRQSGSVDIAQWVSYFAYDFMSDMAFSGGSEMLRDGDPNDLWSLLEEAQPTAVFLGHVPWLAQYQRRLPALGAPLKKFRAFALQCAMNRKQRGTLQKDLFFYLNNEDGQESKQPSLTEVISGGGLAIIAGSDTTATSLSVLFWLLLSNRFTYDKLRAEVDQYFPPGENALDITQHSRMPYLNAVINETLRLFPPLSSGSQRATPRGSQGHVVGPYFIPGGTTVLIPTHALHRDPRNFFPTPDGFWPERWLKEPSSDGKFVHNTSAFIPFSYGPAVCVGKQLAYQEMRMVICLMMQTFDMHFAADFDPVGWEDSLNDFFALTKGKLPVVLTARKDSV